ncbi:hypothetical protein UFOVP144_16 [uncultured Caudovirales phage]|uniref:Uncharacterized protein n=1 Tax=uncultured Caudovirales phage TaxID=2100421 RepID=A0A6J7XM31_9CAUD|nr:hypothetical protein UFOVP144_16 [uncultured Caudovirales phage]
MSRKYNKTGKFAKANQRKQMYVYVDKWVELHTELQELRKQVEELKATK